MNARAATHSDENVRLAHTGYLGEIKSYLDHKNGRTTTFRQKIILVMCVL